MFPAGNSGTEAEREEGARIFDRSAAASVIRLIRDA